MAKTKLKHMDRFELLELIYYMRKANLDLAERLEAAEKKIEELKTEADQRVEAVRAEYSQRLDDLRMQGSAKELQKRMSEIEEQLIAFQRRTGKDTPSENQENEPSGNEEEIILREKYFGSLFAPPEPGGMCRQETPEGASAAEKTASPQESGFEAGESRG